MRVLYIAHCFPPAKKPLLKVGGMQRVGMELLEAFERRDDVSVTPIVLRTTGWGMVAKAVPFYVIVFFRTAWLALTGKIDIVLFSAMPSAALGVLLKPLLMLRGVTLTTICHGHDVIMDSRAYQFLVRLIFFQLDAVMPVSQSTGAECLKRGLTPAKLHVVRNGIDVSRFASSNGPQDASQRWRPAHLIDTFKEQASDLPNNAFVVCAVGRQVKRKGHAWFVANVMPLLPDHVHMWFGGDGPERAAIELAARESEVAHRVRQLGLIAEHEVDALYRGADMFVMPNIRVPGDVEGFGVVILEAGLNGLPVIAARLEGIEDAIDEGQNGHLVESEDAKAFADAIQRYADDRDALDAFRAATIRYTRDTFNWDVAVDQYLGIFRSLMSSKAKPVRGRQI